MTHFLTLANVTTKWRGLGYKGWQDADVGIQHGSRLSKSDMAEELLQLTGNQADVGLDKVPELSEYHATRLDLQVTVELDERHPKLALELYERLVSLPEDGSKIAGRRKVKMVRSQAGDTLYVGSRKTGRRFYRLYDKSIDLGCEIGTMWRQEVQYGREMADLCLGLYMSIRGNRKAVTNLVCAEFQDAIGFSLVPIDELPNNIPNPDARVKAPLSAKLKWLEDCVRPTVALLLEAEMEQELLEALGLCWWSGNQPT